MRIAHVVTLVDQHGAFGGPTAVAREQTRELARRGHDVRLYAGWDGVAGCAPDGVDVRLFRVRRVAPGGFAGLAAPGLLAALGEALPDLDVLHVHLGRDLITLGAARLAVRRDARLVTQTHGMVMPDRRTLARAVDAVATRRVLRAASTAAVLTEVERAGLRAVAGPRVRTELLRNGVAASTAGPGTVRDVPPVVLFCARLHPRKRVLAFAAMARHLVEQGSGASFVVAGADEGDLPRLRAYLAAHRLGDRVRYLGGLAPAEVGGWLARATVYVLPSEREPFPMTVLEAMAEGTPAVVTTGCGISAQLGGARAAVVTDGSPAQLAGAVGALLADAAAAARLGRTAREVVARDYGIAAVVDRLEAWYAR